MTENIAGGWTVFYKKYCCEIANDELSVFKSNGLKAKKIVQCLLKQDFVYSIDFVFVDIELFSRGENSYPFPLDPEVAWLKGYYKDGTVSIIFIEDIQDSKYPKRRNNIFHSARKLHLVSVRGKTQNF